MCTSVTQTRTDQLLNIIRVKSKIRIQGKLPTNNLAPRPVIFMVEQHLKSPLSSAAPFWKYIQSSDSERSAIESPFWQSYQETVGLLTALHCQQGTSVLCPCWCKRRNKSFILSIKMNSFYMSFNI